MCSQGESAQNGQPLGQNLLVRRDETMDLQADLPTVAAALAASLVAADGVIEEREKKVANDLGSEMLPGFNTLIFETLLDGIDELPSAVQLASTMKGLLSDDDKHKIMEYLAALASADDRVVDVEKQELQAVARGLGVEMPPVSA
ncbi:MAG TPA: TerB family tellurite resistance protein [Phycisphaerales bacterium]|nr:TerB family tellurite resistance protein [Phycisphaerales bacterium]